MKALLGLLASLALASLALVPAAGAAGIRFAPHALAVGKVGVRYSQVILVSVAGHHPALGEDYPSYTVDCFGATPNGGFMDDCSKLPPGLKLRQYSGPGCAPPMTKPDCVVVSGTPRRAGRFSFRISAPDASSPSARGIVHRYTLVVRGR